MASSSNFQDVTQHQKEQVYEVLQEDVPLLLTEQEDERSRLFRIGKKYLSYVRKFINISSLGFVVSFLLMVLVLIISRNDFSPPLVGLAFSFLISSALFSMLLVIASVAFVWIDWQTEEQLFVVFINQLKSSSLEQNSVQTLSSFDPITLRTVEKEIKYLIEDREGNKKRSSAFVPVIPIMLILAFVYIFGIEALEPQKFLFLGIPGTIASMGIINLFFEAAYQAEFRYYRKCLLLIEKAQIEQE